MKSIIEVMSMFMRTKEHHHETNEEKMHLLHHAVRINEMDTELIKCELRESYDYLVADPMWIKIRLLLFWTLWISLAAVIVLSIFSNWCWISSFCPSETR